MTHNIAILGASGYTGAELIRLIARIPRMTSKPWGDSKAGQRIAQVFPASAPSGLARSGED